MTLRRETCRKKSTIQVFTHIRYEFRLLTPKFVFYTPKYVKNKWKQKLSFSFLTFRRRKYFYNVVGGNGYIITESNTLNSARPWFCNYFIKSCLFFFESTTNRTIKKYMYYILYMYMLLNCIMILWRNVLLFHWMRIYRNGNTNHKVINKMDFQL